MKKIEAGQLLYNRISGQFAKVIEFSYGSENVVEYTIEYEDGDICIFDENELYDLEIGFAKELDESISIESGERFILRRDLISNKYYGDIYFGDTYFVDGMFENIVTVDKKEDDGFFIKENHYFYTIKMCSHEFIPLSQIDLGEEIKKQQPVVANKHSTFEYIKNNHVDIPQPKFALYAATDEDILQFLKGKSNLYSLDDDKSFYEINHEDEVGLLVHLIEDNKAYVIKSFQEASNA